MSVQAEIAPDGRTLRLKWPDGHELEFGARWLMDHADGAQDPVTGQRSLGALDLVDGRINAARIDAEALKFRLGPSGGVGRISLGRLRDHEGARSHELWVTPEPIERAEPVRFEDYLEDDAALREVLGRVVRRGLARLTGAGAKPGAVRQAVDRFGFIRQTNYGQIFDVRIMTSPSNLAFTERGLELHTDNPYRDPPPTLQLLHAIETDAAGGETVFVDGFAHAEALRREAPDDFEVLAHTPVRFSYADASGARWTARAPILDLDLDGALRAVRLNHRSLDLAPGEGSQRWYDAYLIFQRRVHARDAAFERVLQPGELVIFDNLRILHGRRTLTAGSPRWLQGCYADRDGLEATLARLEGSISGDRADGR
jgi:gamma-butyrobetaine dioxygenase